MRHLIIDTSYLIYRSFFAYPRLTSKNGEPTGAFFGFAKTVFALMKEYKPDTIVFACDTPKPTWRHEVKTDYKAGRPEIDQSMRVQIPLVLDWCNLVTKNVYSLDGYEADDHINTLCFQGIQHVLISGHATVDDKSLFEEERKKSVSLPANEQDYATLSKNIEQEYIIFSSDRDLYQLLVFPGVSFAQTNADKTGFTLFGREEFRTKYDLEPIQWLDYKTLTGDASDNLAGLSGVGPKTATNLLKEVGSLYELFEEMGLENKDFLSGSWAAKSYKEKAKLWTENPKHAKLMGQIRDNFETLCLTHRLSKLQIVPDEKPLVKQYDMHKGSTMFETYGFKSLITMMHNTVGFELGVGESLF
jgi:DNA polymerase I